jgi:hypothetical protein
MLAPDFAQINPGYSLRHCNNRVLHGVAWHKTPAIKPLM